MTTLHKTYPVIGCCGIDCALCPHYYTKGSSTCPGCGGPQFNEKHPSCGILTCCVRKHGLEVCAQCPEYPCARFEPQKINRDSFVTHQKIFANHDRIREKGIDDFIKLQAQRVRVLEALLEHYDEGRSKSYFCLAAALLPLGDIEALNDTLPGIPSHVDIKEKNRLVRYLIDLLARQRGIELTLKK